MSFKACDCRWASQLNYKSQWLTQSSIEFDHFASLKAKRWMKLWDCWYYHYIKFSQSRCKVAFQTRHNRCSKESAAFMPDLAKCSAILWVESIVRNAAVDQREARVTRLLHSVCNRVNANWKNLPGQLQTLTQIRLSVCSALFHRITWSLCCTSDTDNNK